MPLLGPALGYLTAMCSPGWGNLVAFDWNDLPVGREFDGKFFKNVKSPPHALPSPPPPADLTLIAALLLTIEEKEIETEEPKMPLLPNLWESALSWTQTYL